MISKNRVRRTSSSSYGPELDIMAPGENILSTMFEWYYPASGTSMASPYVTGVCALLLSQDPTLTPAKIKTILFIIHYYI